MASIRELTDEHIKMIEPFLPKVRLRKRANLKKTLNGICHVLRTGCSWRDIPTRYGHHKTAYNMFRRYCRSGVWDRVLVFLASQDPDLEAAMADATIVKAHRTSMSMAAGAGKERAIGKSRGGPTTKLHTLSDAQGRYFGFHLTGGQDAAQDRKRLCQTQGLETRRTARPQMPKDPSRSGHLGRNREILAVSGFNEFTP